jgi:hypothetical protein
VTLTPQPSRPDPGLPTSLDGLLRHDAAALEAILSTDDLAVENARLSAFLPFLAWLISSLKPALTVDLGFEVDSTFHATWRAAQRTKSPARCVAVLLAEAGQTAQERESMVRKFNDRIAESAIRSDGRLEGAVEDLGQFGGEDDDNTDGFPPIHLLHVGLSQDETREPQYLGKWIDRVTPGGVIVVPDTQMTGGGQFSAMHRYVADRVPATVLSIGATADVLVAQVPLGDATALIDLLRQAPPAFRGLFALFAERSEFRHLLGPEPASPMAVSALLESLTESRRVERETFQVALRTSRETMAALATQSGMLRAELMESKEQAAIEKAVMQNEYFGRLDELGAKLSTSAAHYSREITERELEIAARVRQAEILAGEAAEAQRKLAELLTSSSWRVTAPVRLLSRLMGSARSKNASP